MKKSLYFAAMAALAFTACTNGDDVTADVAGKGDVAVGFDAPYLSTTTRADVITTNGANETASLQDLGFGVFAYEQGTTSWDTYRASNVYPNFFYNQKVKYEGENWTYAPVKYFSNNNGAKHSFFVYAPYKESINAVFSMANTAPVIRYSAKEDYDLLWAPAIVDQPKPAINTKLSFTFKHALSKVTFDVAPFIDKVHEDAAHTATEKLTKNTTITVRSVKFTGKVPSQGLLNLKTGDWIIEATEEGAYEITTPVDFKGVDDEGTTITRATLVKNMMVIPSEKVRIKVVYDVITKDETNPKNNSSVTNTVESEQEFNLVQGTAYTFHLDLGMTTVKFTADVAGWGDEDEKNVDLPNNTNVGLVAVTVPASAEAPTTGAVGDIYKNTTDSKYYECTEVTPTWTELTVTTLKSLAKNANGKYVAADNTETELTADKYYVVGDNLYIAQ